MVYHDRAIGIPLNKKIDNQKSPFQTQHSISVRLTAVRIIGVYVTAHAGVEGNKTV